MRRIKPLPEAVRSSVRSGIILYDLTRVVEELVFNSLDAGATKVSVAVDVGTCFVKVVDNGSGIDRDGLVLAGQRYATSKHGQVADLDANDRNYGSRGEALCSISDVSLLEIITKAHGRPHGYRKVMKGCKRLYLGINDDRHDVGTTVVVRDLFYNQPVRRKHMLSSLKKVLHLVKKSVLRIALVHPGVSFRVVDIESEDELLSTHPSPSPLPLLSSNFGIEAACSLHELKASEGDFKLSGYMSGSFGILSLKAFQYIYINSRFVCKGPIHKLLNQLAAAYWDNKKFSIGVQNEKRSRSQIYPTFILNVSCPRSYYDTTFETLRNSVEFVDWDPVLVFIQNAVTDFWSEYKSNDFPVNSGSGRKRSRTRKCQALPEASSSETQKRIEDCNFLSAGRENSSSSQKSCGDASELNKRQTDALFIHDDGRAIQLCGVTANRKIHKTMQPSGGYFSDEYDLLVKQLSTKDACRKEVDNFVDSQWQDESFEMEDWVNKSIKSPPYTLSHEFGDDADVNQVFRKPTQLSCSRGRCLQDVGPFFVCKAGIEFKSDDFSMQQKWLDMDEGVDFGRQDDIDKLFKESLSRKNEIKPLWSFSRCTNQHDTVANSNILSQDLRSSLIAGECSGEENCLLSDPFKHIEQLSHNEHSSTSEWSPLAENSLFDGENGSFEFGEGTRCAYSPDREGDYCKLDFNTAINGWDQQNCTEFSSDCEFSGLQGDVNEIGGHRIKDNIFPDEMDLLHIHFFDKNGLSKFLDPLDHKSLRAQSSRNKYGRTPIRNEETMFHHKGVRRSHSAPPFYKPRRKYFALNHLLNSEAGRFNSPAINNGSSFPGTSNLKHKQQSFGQCHSPSKANYVDDSLSVPRLENKELQNKGQCVGGCILNPVEDSLPKDNQNVLDSGVKWRNSSPQSAVVVSSLNTRDHDPVLDISSGILHLTGDSLVPSSIDKNCLKDANVLQQVDKKFIPVVADRILVIIDQHAADERIRLEELRQKVLSGEMKQITYLEAEQELVLPEIGYQLLRNYADQIHNWGWICNIYGPGSRSFGKNLNVLYRQPTIAKLIAVPCILGVNLTDVDLLEFLQQLADTDGSATVPPSVNRVLNNKACRGAIMFGDTLLPSECSLIVEELKQTSLCFQCAHGRPTTVPLVNLDVLHKQIDKLGLCSSGTDEPWQGLRRHEISLERAAHRLSSAID